MNMGQHQIILVNLQQEIYISKNWRIPWEQIYHLKKGNKSSSASQVAKRINHGWLIDFWKEKETH